MLDGVTPVAIHAASFTAKTYWPRPFSVKLGEEVSAAFSASLEGSDIDISKKSFTIRAKIAVDVKGKKRRIAKLEAEYHVVFRANTGINEEFINIFATSSFPMMVHPYMREFVQSSMIRLGLPPIILPLIVLKPPAKDSRMK